MIEEGQEIRNVVLEDHDLDERMRYTSVDLKDFAQARVTAYDQSGGVLYDAVGLSDKIVFDNSIKDSIARIQISAPEMKIGHMQKASCVVGTELRDPAAITYEDCVANDDPNFTNTLTATSADVYRLGKNVENGPHDRLSNTDHIQIN